MSVSVISVRAGFPYVFVFNSYGIHWSSPSEYLRSWKLKVELEVVLVGLLVVLKVNLLVLYARWIFQSELSRTLDPNKVFPSNFKFKLLYQARVLFVCVLFVAAVTGGEIFWVQNLYFNVDLFTRTAPVNTITDHRPPFHGSTLSFEGIHSDCSSEYHNLLIISLGLLQWIPSPPDHRPPTSSSTVQHSVSNLKVFTRTAPVNTSWSSPDHRPHVVFHL